MDYKYITNCFIKQVIWSAIYLFGPKARYTGIENTLLYASVSRGFKSGGFQGQLSFDPAALQPFDDENVLAYEAGTS